MRLKLITAGSLIALFSLTAPRSAAAQSGLDACGNIWIEPQVSCEVEPPGLTCEAEVHAPRL